MRTAGARLLLYSPDSYGLGHLRRTLLIAESLAAQPAEPTVLVVTGSPCGRAYALPRGVDMVTLPSATKTADGVYRSRALRVPLQSLVDVRSALVSSAVDAFRPDVILVDHAPTGVGGELRPVLADVRSHASRPALVLGLRDVVDHPDAVCAEWTRDATWSVLGLFDRILCYGDERVGTTATDLDLGGLYPGRVHHTGYVARASANAAMPPGADSCPRTVVVTTGGGADGEVLLTTFAKYLRTQRTPLAFRSVVVTGPLLAEESRQDVSALFDGLQLSVDVLEFTPHMEDVIAASSAVIAMAGYNTVAEAMASGRPSLLVPRETPRREQVVRAERLANVVPNVETCRASDVDTHTLDDFLSRAFRCREPQAEHGRTPVALDGVRRVTDHLMSLIDANPSLPDHHGRVSA